VKTAELDDLLFQELRRTNATAMVVAGFGVKTAPARLGYFDPRLNLVTPNPPSRVEVSQLDYDAAVRSQFHNQARTWLWPASDPARKSLLEFISC
jgi:hypothetical protein